jgi:hypothetical protein
LLTMIKYGIFFYPRRNFYSTIIINNGKGELLTNRGKQLILNIYS